MTELKRKILDELIRMLQQSNLEPDNRDPPRFIKQQKAHCVLMEDVFDDTLIAIMRLIKEETSCQ
jgi:hypothetical protein